MSEENGSEEVVLKAWRQKQVVKIQFEEDGPVEELTLVSLTGAEKSEFQKYTGDKTRYGKDGTPLGLKDSSGVEERLLSLALRAADGKPVPEPTIKGWTVEVQQYLLKKVVKMNGLSKEDGENVKN